MLVEVCFFKLTYYLPLIFPELRLRRYIYHTGPSYYNPITFLKMFQAVDLRKPYTFQEKSTATGPLYDYKGLLLRWRDHIDIKIHSLCVYGG